MTDNGADNLVILDKEDDDDGTAKDGLDKHNGIVANDGMDKHDDDGTKQHRQAQACYIEQK